MLTALTDPTGFPYKFLKFEFALFAYPKSVTPESLNPFFAGSPGKINLPFPVALRFFDIFFSLLKAQNARLKVLCLFSQIGNVCFT